MKERLLTIAVSILIVFTTNAQQTDYSQGTFILNEDWFGHNNSSINFITNEGEIFYRVYAEENTAQDLSLGCTSQYGTIYGGKLYIMSKQNQDAGDNRTGGRFIIADATTLQHINHFDYLEQNDEGNSMADGRACAGIDENTIYLGSTNGIYIYNTSENRIVSKIAGTENPLITGNENNANGQGPLYNNQIGHIIRGAENVFVVYQDKGILVIDPNTHSIKKTINGCFSSMEQSKDGNIWAVRNINPDAQHYPYGGANFGNFGEDWEGKQFVKINQFTLDTSSVDIPEDIPGIRQTWYAWTDGGFCASAKQNCLYWTDDGGWFKSYRVYKYDIDNNQFSKIFDAHNIAQERNIYGAGIGIDPETDILSVFLFNEFTDQRNWIVNIDNGGELINNYELIQNYWFPAMTMFSDIYLPEISNIPDTIILDGEGYELYLGDKVTDQDNLDAAIVKSVHGIEDANLANIYIQHDKLKISSKSSQIIGETNFILSFNSNGKKVSKKLHLKIPEHLYLQQAIADVYLAENNADTSINISENFVFPGQSSNNIQLQVEENLNQQLVTCSIINKELKIQVTESKYGTAELIIKATAQGQIVRDTLVVHVNANPVLITDIPNIITYEDYADTSINIAQYFHDPDNEDKDITYTILSNTNSTLLSANILDSIITIKLNLNQFGESNLQVEALSNTQTCTANIKINVNPVDDPLYPTGQPGDIYVMENSADTVVNLSESFTDPDNDDSLIQISIIENTNQDLLSYNLIDKDLSLSFTADAVGQSKIVMQADLNGYSVTDTLIIFVKDVDMPLYCANKISDTTINKNHPNIELDLSDVFTDPDNNDSDINISVLSNSTAGLISTSVNQQVLTLHAEENQIGFTQLVIQGELNGYTATDTFMVYVDDPLFTANPLADITVTVNSPNEILDIENVFIDPDATSPIQVIVFENSNVDLVKTQLEENTIELEFTKDMFGEAEIVIRAESDGLFAYDTIMVTVDQPIYLENPLDDIIVDINSEDKQINLEEVFTDPDNNYDETEYVITNSNEQLVDISVQNHIANISFQEGEIGEATIIIEASLNNYTAVGTFLIKVIDNSNIYESKNLPLVLYPTLLQDKLKIESGFEIEQIVLYNSIGRTVKVENIERKTFYEMNLSELQSGCYFIMVKGKKGSVTKKLIKQ